MSHTNHDVAHLWANQSKPSARSSNGNFHFSGDTIYSYSTPIARLILDPATGSIMAVLRTSQSFSMTTSSKHQPAISSALRYDAYPILRVPHIQGTWSPEGINHDRNLDHFVKHIDALAARARRSTSNAEWVWQGVQSSVTDGNEYIKLFNCHTHAAFVMPADHAESLAKSLARLERLNNPDPASLDKRERDRARRHAAKRAADERQAAANLARMADIIVEWKAGRQGSYLPYGAPMLLRLSPSDPNTLETSKGAHVPLADAVRVFRFAAQCKSGLVQWQAKSPRPRVGDFHVDAIDEDGTIHAGCHTIPWEESARMAASIGIDI